MTFLFIIVRALLRYLMGDISSDTSVPTMRHEIISEVISITKNPIIDIFQKLYTKVKDENKSRRFLLRDFQIAVKSIADWTVEDIKNNFHSFQTDRLIVLSNRLENLGCDVISWDQTIFECLLSIARELWRKPFLLFDGVNITVYQENTILFEKVVTNTLKMHLRRITECIMIQENIQKAQANTQFDFDHLVNDNFINRSQNQSPALSQYKENIDDEFIPNTPNIPSIIDNDIENTLYDKPISRAQSLCQSHHSADMQSQSSHHNIDYKKGDEYDDVDMDKESMTSSKSGYSVDGIRVIDKHSRPGSTDMSESKDEPNKKADLKKLDIMAIIPRTNVATSEEKIHTVKKAAEVYGKYYDPEKTIKLLKKKI